MGIGEEFFFGGGDDLLGGDVAEDKKYHALGAIVRFHPVEGNVGRLGDAAESFLGAKDWHCHRTALKNHILNVVVDEFARRIVVALNLV